MSRLVALLRSRLVWALALALVVIFGIAYAFVQMKTRDCELLCGESSHSKAKYHVNATGGSRYPSKPATSACICGEASDPRQ
jgi:hypothetical protein